MEKPFVIIMMGFTGTGKSTTARYLAKKLNTAIFHSAVTRKELNFTFTKEEAKEDFFDLTSNNRTAMDKQVYAENARRCVAALKEGKNVILDAGYFFTWQRKQVYEETKPFHPEIIILRILCDEEQIKERFKQRLDNFHKDVFAETPSWKTYESSKVATEFPDNKDKLPSGEQPTIIEFNTQTHTAQIAQGKPTSTTELIIDTLQNYSI